MRGATVVVAALLGCAPEGVVIFPDAGPVAPRLDVPLATDLAAGGDAPASDGLPPTDDLPDVEDRSAPNDLPDLDPDGGAPPACGASARLEDPAGDYVVVGNPSGGRFVLEVDVTVRAVGVIAAGPVAIAFTGARLGALQRVLVVGPDAVAASITGFDLSRVDRVSDAPSPLLDADGVATMRCAAGCDALRPPRELGCNSRDQVLAFFTARLGKGRRWALLQRATLDGLRVRAGGGGCCL